MFTKSQTEFLVKNLLVASLIFGANSLSAEESLNADIEEYPGEFVDQAEEKDKAIANAQPNKWVEPKQLVVLRGPKRTVSVGKFSTTGAFSSKYGSWDIGGGLQAMLTKALYDSNRFVVVERANLTDVLTEQQLKASGVSNRETGPKFNKVIGAQFIVYAAVTEFGYRDSGGGISAGLVTNNFFNGAISSQSSQGAIALDIRVVDTTTGQVVRSHTVRETIEASGFDASIGYRGVSFGGNKFQKSPLGQVARLAINRSVQLISRDLQDTQWKGNVVDVDNNEIYINAGHNAGVKVGDRFNIERVTKQFTDPVTGEILGTRKKILGSIKITGVDAKLAFGAYTPSNRSIKPRRSDIVVEAR